MATAHGGEGEEDDSRLLDFVEQLQVEAPRQRQRSSGDRSSGMHEWLNTLLVIILFAGLRERLETADTPVAFRGAAISLVTAAFMALGFMGFAGMVHG